MHYSSIIVIFCSLGMIWLGADAILTETFHFKMGAFVSGNAAIIIGGICIFFGFLLIFLTIDTYLLYIKLSKKNKSERH